MVANQEEFVYVTWQERERTRAAMEYLEMTKRRAIINQSARERQKRNEASQAKDSDVEVKSQLSFDPKKLSQPKTIPFERI